jgi:uncharacterized protein (UPF0261 family)
VARQWKSWQKPGQFVGVIDFTPSEIVGALVGGIHYGGPRRMKRVGPLGVPQILVPACVDFTVHHTTSITNEFKNRPIYDHNPEFALARCTKSEMGEIGAYFAECANTATGPVEVVIPGEGYSIPNVPGGVFWDRDADAHFESELRKNLKPEIEINKLPLHANSSEFGVAVAKEFLSLVAGK